MFRNFSIRAKLHEFAESHQIWDVHVVARPFLFVEYRGKRSIAFERARAGDFPMYNEVIPGISWEWSDITVKLSHFMINSCLNLIISSEAIGAIILIAESMMMMVPNRIQTFRGVSGMILITLECVSSTLHTIFLKCDVESAFSWSTFILRKHDSYLPTLGRILRDAY